MTRLFTLLFVTVLALTNAASAQIIFSEDFDGIPGPTAGGAGTYVFPSGWLLRNVDNYTPSPSVSYVDEAWERREDFANNVGDSAAFSTSWYAPGEQADDWMWTPLIGPITANSRLTWNAVAYDPMFPDGYEVRVMTAASGPPTGGTSDIGNQVTNSTVVFTIASEVSNWTSHLVSLSAYAGQSIYIGFRNHSTDQFLLLIDDVEVADVVNYDAAVSNPLPSGEYTQVPLSQVQPVVLGADVVSNGGMSITNVRLQVDVKNMAGTTVYTDTSSAVASLASGDTAHLTVTPYTPSAVDTYSIHYSTLINETDGMPINDSLTVSDVLMVTDSTYARDDGNVTASLGIGAGTGGYLGQQFEIFATDTLTSVTFEVEQGYTGTNAALAIWNMSGGLPNAIIAGTDTMLYPDDSARYYTLPIYGAPLVLSPGVYTVTAIEFDSTLALGQTNTVFTPMTTWVDWPGSPFGGWAHNEDFGVGFAKPYVIRPNFGSAAPPASYDAGVGSPDLVSEYTRIPLTQTQPMNLGATITNNGATTVTNVMLMVDVKNSGGTTVYSAMSASVAFLAPSASSHFTVPTYTPSAIDTYSVHFQTMITETDGNSTNDILVLQDVLMITDSTYARDDNTVTSSLGIGAGTGGYLGQEFQIVATDTLTSVSFYVTQGYTGTNMALAVWDMSGGSPNVMIGGTDTLTYPDDSARYYTLPIHGGFLPLTTGTYAVTAIEFDSTIQVGLTDNIFNVATTWVDWPGNPFGGWAHNEDFGASFEKTYVIRPELGDPGVINPYVNINNNSTSVSVFPNPARNVMYVNVRTQVAGDMTVELYDATGRMVKGGVYSSGVSAGSTGLIRPVGHNASQVQLNVSDVTAGLYFVVVRTGSEVIKTKVSISR